MADPNLLPPPDDYDFQRSPRELAVAGLEFADYPFKKEGIAEDIPHSMATGCILVDDHEFNYSKSSTPEIVVRSIKYLWKDRLLDQNCFNMGQEHSRTKTSCGCCAIISSLVKTDCEEDLEKGLEKWMPRLEVVATLGLKLLELENEEAVVFFLSKVIGIEIHGKGGYRVLLPLPDGTTMKICLSLFYDVMGYEQFHGCLNDFQKNLKNLLGPQIADLSNVFSRLTRQNVFASLIPSFAERGLAQLMVDFAMNPRNKRNHYSKKTVPLMWLGPVEAGVNLPLLSNATFQNTHWGDLRELFKQVIFTNAPSIRIAHPRLQAHGGQPMFTLPIGNESPHFGNAGASDMSELVGGQQLIETSLQLLMDVAGFHGKRSSPLLTADDLCPRIVCSLPKPPTENDSLARLLQDFDISGAKFPEVQPILQAFWQHMKTACLGLIPNKPRPDAAYKLYSTSAFRITTRDDLKNLDQVAQVPHLFRRGVWLDNLVTNGAYVLHVLVPLTPEGCCVRVHTGPNDGPGTLVFIPLGQMFILPATMIHGDGYRTGILGNPCLQFLVVALPREHEADILHSFDPFGDTWGDQTPKFYPASFGHAPAQHQYHAPVPHSFFNQVGL